LAEGTRTHCAPTGAQSPHKIAAARLVFIDGDYIINALRGGM